MFKLKCDDFLIYDEESGAYYMSDEQKVRDETERNRWKNTGWTVLKDWRLYIMLVPMLLVYFLWKYMPMYELMGCFKDPMTGDQLHVASYSWTGLRYFQHVQLAVLARVQEHLHDGVLRSPFRLPYADNFGAVLQRG